MKVKKVTRKPLIALAFLMCVLMFPIRAYATEVDADPNVPYEGEIITGTGETGNNHTASVILIDETGEYDGGNLYLTFEDVTGANSKTVRVQEAYYKSGTTYDIYLVAPGTYNITSTVGEGYKIVDTLSGELFTNYAAYGESSIVLLSIQADGEAAAEGGAEPQENSTILNSGTKTPGETDNAEAQEVYQELLDSIAFIATDESWANILEIKGKFGLDEKTYNHIIPEGEHRTPYEELSDFDCLVYNYTYCTFAASKAGSVERWQQHTASREAMSYYYQDFLNFKPTEGNNREAVNAAFNKLWDWQYEYIKEHDEPYNFVENCSYTSMGFGVVGSGTKTPADEIGLDESDKKEIEQEIKDEEVPLAGEPLEPQSTWGEVMDALSHSLLSIGILVVGVIGLIIVFFIKRRKNVDDMDIYGEE